MYAELVSFKGLQLLFSAHIISEDLLGLWLCYQTARDLSVLPCLDSRGPPTKKEPCKMHYLIVFNPELFTRMDFCASILC